MPDYDEESIPIEATITRTGSLSRTVCDAGHAIVGFSNVGLGVGNAGPFLDTTVFGCSLQYNDWEPDGLLPGPWDALDGRAPIKRSQFTKAKPGKPIVFHMHGSAPCKIEAPQTCTEASADWTVTIRFVCRAKRDAQSCLTKKVRRKLGI